MNTKKLKMIKIGIDAVFIVIVNIACLVIFVISPSPFQRGFFCSDESLMYPYKDDTVQMSVAFVVGVIPLVVTITLLEGINSWFQCKGNKLSTSATVKFCAVAIGVNVAITEFGAVLTMLITEVLKLVVGRLRPHFFDVCKPNFDTLNCSVGYMTDFSCLATRESNLVDDARKSFPSGHSSFVMYCMTYVIIYLQLRLPRRSLRLMRGFFQFCAALVALYVCASRISDYKHHWSDVLSGAILGVVAAALTIGYVSDLVPPGCAGERVGNSDLMQSVDTSLDVSGSYKKHDVEMQRS